MSQSFLVIHGPNLNLLGSREPEVYGSSTLETVNEMLSRRATESGVSISFFQSNHEGAIVDRIQQAKNEGVTGVIINPGAYTHTSIAIRDAISGTGLAVVEVHISNVHAREEFRKHSYIAPVSVGQIAGLGIDSYRLALEFFLGRIKN